MDGIWQPDQEDTHRKVSIYLGNLERAISMEFSGPGANRSRWRNAGEERMRKETAYAESCCKSLALNGLVMEEVWIWFNMETPEHVCKLLV